MKQPGKAVEVLLVESNPADARLTREAFNDSQIRNRLTVAGDGIEAMALLRKEGEYARCPRPDIIILELNLPKRDGRELLAEIKRDPELKRIPVVVLTSSHAAQDIRKAYELHANCYFIKPTEAGDFLSLVRMIEDFWLTVVRLPNA